MKDSYEINMTVNGQSGTAEVVWVPDSIYNVAHYEVLLSVPFQDSRWEHLFIHDKSKLDEAIEKAKENLKFRLQRCTLF
jgi:hypothetical protein